MLTKEGYDCGMAHDGAQALEMIGTGKPGLVFLDVDMPVKNGYETAQAIRSNPEWKDIHIIMLTAKGQEIDEKRGRESGADEYILKPFDPKAILARVKEIL